jgi:hypothetical protein
MPSPRQVGELLDRFPSAHQLKLDHVSWATIATLTRQSRRLLRVLQAVEITGWKARENLIEVEHAIGSLLSCTPCLASLSISLVCPPASRHRRKRSTLLPLAVPT